LSEVPPPSEEVGKVVEDWSKDTDYLPLEFDDEDLDAGEESALPPVATVLGVDDELVGIFLEEAAELEPRIAESKLLWRENPGDTGEWKTHEVAEVGNIERCLFCDINGDGFMEALPVTKPVHIFQLIRDANGKGAGEFKQYTIPVGGGGHGIGCGDINGNGRMDIVFATGWLEAPENPLNNLDGWIWHEEFNFGLASVPILVHDVNEDGLADLIVGMGHDYGLFWMEQGRDADGNRAWTRHDIDMERSQFHDIQLVDLDNDGKLDLVTGKRRYAHNGNDPGADDPLFVSYYKINKGEFKRYNIDFGPIGEASGVGIYFWVEDVNGNGWKDILAPGKEGLYLFLNQGNN